MKNLFDPETHREIVERIRGLQPDTRAAWGKMNVAQMLAHCSEILDVFVGNKELKGTPWFVGPFKGLIRKALFSDKPFGRGVRTHPQYVARGTFDFDTERDRLLNLVETFVTEDQQIASVREHPILGKSTAAERGHMMYKHLDHHLRQFAQ